MALSYRARQIRGFTKPRGSIDLGRVGSGRVGSGRVGSGRVGSGRVGVNSFFVVVISGSCDRKSPEKKTYRYFVKI